MPISSPFPLSPFPNTPPPLPRVLAASHPSPSFANLRAWAGGGSQRTAARSASHVVDARQQGPSAAGCAVLPLLVLQLVSVCLLGADKHQITSHHLQPRRGIARRLHEPAHATAVAAAVCDACTALHAFPKLKMFYLEFMVAPLSEIFKPRGNGTRLMRLLDHRQLWS